jgi:hypothetical protein
VGFTPGGNRIVKRGSGRTKTEAQRKLREIIRDHEDGQIVSSSGYTVAQAVRDWLQFGLSGRRESTITKYAILANTHVIPALGSRKLRELSADDVDRWLARKAKTLNTDTLRILHSILRWSITRGQGPGQGKTQRRAPLRCPAGAAGPPVQVAQQRPGRCAPGRCRGQAAVCVHRRLAAHWCPNRGTTCPHLVACPARCHSAGHHGLAFRPYWWRHQDKEVTSRTLEPPQRRADTLRLHRERQDQLRKRAGDRWHDNDLVFASCVGTALWAGSVRRSFRVVLAAAGLDPADWTPREPRHGFVSLMSAAGVPVEKIARLVGHTGTATTETVYRKQLRPVIVGGAEVIDVLFPMRDLPPA